MWDTVWNLSILVTMAQIPPLVVIGATSSTWHWAHMVIILIKKCDNH